MKRLCLISMLVIGCVASVQQYQRLVKLPSLPSVINSDSSAQFAVIPPQRRYLITNTISLIIVDPYPSPLYKISVGCAVRFYTNSFMTDIKSNSITVVRWSDQKFHIALSAFRTGVETDYSPEYIYPGPNYLVIDIPKSATVESTDSMTNKLWIVANGLAGFSTPQQLFFSTHTGNSYFRYHGVPNQVKYHFE